jgi:transcriptional regulator with XRE-family HTH domain
MSIRIKSKHQAIALGNELRSRRKSLGISLLKAEKDWGIDVGQLSRFENGNFKFISKNLQIYLNKLQIKNLDLLIEDDLISRFTQALKKSTKHLEAGAHMVTFLESLDI